MKLAFLFQISVIIVLLNVNTLFAQVGIGTTTPDPSSILDIHTSDKGLLIPRIALNDISDTSLDGTNPAATGLLIYNTNATVIAGSGEGYYYFDGTVWVKLTTGATALQAENGLNVTNNNVRLGGSLIEDTSIALGENELSINLNGLGDFRVQDNGVPHFSVESPGDSRFGGDVTWRDESTNGTILALLDDDGNDGRLRIYENGIPSIDLDANTQFVFNDQGLDRNFRVESNTNTNMLFVDAGTNRIGIGTGLPTEELHINGSVRIVDGTQQDGRVLTSNANGTASWEDPSIDNVVGVLGNPGVNIPANTTNYLQTGSRITLPPGTFAVNVTMLLRPNTGQSPNDSSFWLRTSFSLSPNANPTITTDIQGSTLVSGILGGASRFSLVTGTVIIRNNTALPRIYYYVAGNTTSINTTNTLQTFGGSFWSENNIIAYRLN